MDGTPRVRAAECTDLDASGDGLILATILADHETDGLRAAGHQDLRGVAAGGLERRTPVLAVAQGPEAGRERRALGLGTFGRIEPEGNDLHEADGGAEATCELDTTKGHSQGHAVVDDADHHLVS